MNISISKRRGDTGIALVIALVLTLVIAFGAASFGYLVYNQHRSVMRSQEWNNVMPVAESGIEEALTQLYYTGTNTPGNGWVRGADGLYRKTRNIGTNGSYYTVSIFMSNKPVVVSTGFGRAPLSSNLLTRAVQVKLVKSPTGKGGITARGTITFSGGAFLDSFDSSDPNYSTNGLYTVSKRKDNGQAISNAKVAGAISLSGGGIYGTATTGPGGTITTSGSARVGDIAWVTDSANSGVEPGHGANDANVDFPAVDPPTVSGFYTPFLGLFNGTNYTYLLTAGKYYTSSKMTIPGGGAMAIIGDVTLYVNNDFVTSGSGYIYMYPGSSLKLYVSGAFTVSGGGIFNGTQDASKLSIYGLNTTTLNWTYSGSSVFIGTVYAPNSNFTFSGGAGASGAFTANNITISGSAGVHYDENLVGGRRGYVVSSWNEL